MPRTYDECSECGTDFPDDVEADEVEETADADEEHPRQYRMAINGSKIYLDEEDADDVNEKPDGRVTGAEYVPGVGIEYEGTLDYDGEGELVGKVDDDEDILSLIPDEDDPKNPEIFHTSSLSTEFEALADDASTDAGRELVNIVRERLEADLDDIYREAFERSERRVEAARSKPPESPIWQYGPNGSEREALDAFEAAGLPSDTRSLELLEMTRKVNLREVGDVEIELAHYDPIPGSAITYHRLQPYAFLADRVAFPPRSSPYEPVVADPGIIFEIDVDPTWPLASTLDGFQTRPFDVILNVGEEEADEPAWGTLVPVESRPPRPLTSGEYRYYFEWSNPRDDAFRRALADAGIEPAAVAGLKKVEAKRRPVDLSVGI